MHDELPTQVPPGYSDVGLLDSRLAMKPQTTVQSVLMHCTWHLLEMPEGRSYFVQHALPSCTAHFLAVGPQLGAQLIQPLSAAMSTLPFALPIGKRLEALTLSAHAQTVQLTFAYWQARKYILPDQDWFEGYGSWAFWKCQLQKHNSSAPSPPLPPSLLPIPSQGQSRAIWTHTGLRFRTGD